jgi:hypothetical protein
MLRAARRHDGGSGRKEIPIAPPALRGFLLRRQPWSMGDFVVSTPREKQQESPASALLVVTRSAARGPVDSPRHERTRRASSGPRLAVLATRCADRIRKPLPAMAVGGLSVQVPLPGMSHLPQPWAANRREACRLTGFVQVREALPHGRHLGDEGDDAYCVQRIVPVARPSRSRLNASGFFVESRSANRSGRQQLGEADFRLGRCRDGRRLREGRPATIVGMVRGVLLQSAQLMATQTDQPREARCALRTREGLWY